jgi:hypothetical protein
MLTSSRTPECRCSASCVHKPGDVYEFDYNDKYAPNAVNDTAATTMDSYDWSHNQRPPGLAAVPIPSVVRPGVLWSKIIW